MHKGALCFMECLMIVLSFFLPVMVDMKVGALCSRECLIIVLSFFLPVMVDMKVGALCSRECLITVPLHFRAGVKVCTVCVTHLRAFLCSRECLITVLSLYISRLV